MVADLAVNISANIKDLQRNIGKAKATLKNFGNSAGALGAGLTASLTLSIASLGGVALKTASDFEQLEVRLQTLTGSAKAGRKQFELLQKFSAGTPFQLQDLVKANNTLLGFGLSADEAFTSLQQLGDVASATGADLQSIAVAFGQSSAEGKLFTRDIRQFINQGVPAVDLLAESMGVARSEVFTLAEEGKISFKVLQDAISQATSAGGKFAGATKAQSQTIAGLFSTLRDNVSLALGELGKELVRAFNLDKLVTDLTNKIKAVTIVFKALSSDVKKQMFIIAGVLGASGPVLLAFKAIIGIITVLSFKVIALVAVISGVGYIFKSAFDEAGSVTGMFKLIFTKMVNGVIDDLILMVGALSALPFGVGSTFASITGQLIKFKSDTKAQSDAFTPLEDGFNKIKDTFNLLSALIQRVKLQMSEGFQITVDAPDTSSFKDILYNDIERPLEDLKVKLTELPEISKSAFQNMVEGIKSVGDQLKDFLANEIGGAFVKLGDTIGRSLSGADDSMATAFEKIILIVLDFAKSLAMLAGGIGGVMLFIPGLQGTGIALLAAATALSAIAGGFTAGIQKRIGNREARAEESMRAMAGSSVPNQSMMNLSGEFRVKGTDLVLSLAEANYSLGR
jgi:tape measure domain-containing protein